MKSQLSIFVLLLALSAIPAYTQTVKKPRTDADYHSRTLREMTTLQPDYIARDPQSKDPNMRIIVHADLLPSRVKAHYDGTTRPPVEIRKGVITAWADRPVPVLEIDTAPYQTEMLFTEDSQSYWLVVRTDSLAQFQQQLKKGDMVELFLVKLGNAQIDGKLEPVLLVEKFVKQ